MVYSAVQAFCQEVAANLLQKGMGPEEIAEVTKLSRDQVETLQQKMNDTSVG